MNSSEKTPEDINNGDAKNLPESEGGNATLEQSPKSEKKINPRENIGQPDKRINEQIDAIKERLENGAPKNGSAKEIHKKPRDLVEVRKEVKKFRAENGLGLPIGVDKKIFDLVVGLCRWGVETMSCDEGHYFTIWTGRVAFPYVSFTEKDRNTVKILWDEFNHPDHDEWEITDPPCKLCPKARPDITFPLLQLTSLNSRFFRQLPQEIKHYQEKRRELDHWQETARLFGEWLQNLPDNYDFSKRKSEQ